MRKLTASTATVSPKRLVRATSSMSGFIAIGPPGSKPHASTVKSVGDSAMPRRAFLPNEVGEVSAQRTEGSGVMTHDPSVAEDGDTSPSCAWGGKDRATGVARPQPWYDSSPGAKGAERMRLIGVDVGGTFTDLVYADTDAGRTAVHKVSTTPDDPSRGVVQGLMALCDRYGIPRSTIDVVFHGTTIATNSILEHDGAAPGMITTGGYRDILHIGRHQRPQHYSIMQDIPWQDRPLVKRRHRKTVKERLVPPKGEVLEPLDEAGVRQAVRELKEAGVQAIAICFLFSYLDPAHEARALAIVREEYPECFATTSSSVSPQFREFERFTTTAMNAFVGPKVRNYVTRLESEIGNSGFKADLRIMASNGGVATPSMVAERPVLTLLSGPAAGVIGGDWAGGLSGQRNLITFDIGGTSADIGIVTQGGFGEATARDTWIAGFPVLVPMIDVHTIGAGGGSIAFVRSEEHTSE